MKLSTIVIGGISAFIIGSVAKKCYTFGIEMGQQTGKVLTDYAVEKATTIEAAPAQDTAAVQ